MTGDILVIRGGAIGDFILTLPALTALRRQFPQSRLEILGYPHIANLALVGKMVDGVRPIEDPALAPFFVSDAELPTRWADFFAGFSLIISYAFDPGRILENNIKRCSTAQFIAAPHRPGEFEKIHATTFFLAPLQQIGISDADPMPRLDISAPSRSTSDHCIAAHPGSGSPTKNWPEENWLELLTEISGEKNWRCLLIGGEAEGDRLRRFRTKIFTDRIEIADHLPLTELAQKLRSCAAFIGHDSGISHLAAAMRIPVLVLWGPTNETIWRPLSGQTTILLGGDKLLQLHPKIVFHELQRKLGSITRYS